MKITLTFLACVIFVVRAQASIAIKVENAKSANGKYTLEAIGEKDADGCRIELKALPGGKVVGRFSHGDFYASDHRYTISAVWKEDSSAFALNITQGRNITLCRVFVDDRGSWKEARLPKKAIEKIRAEGNTEGGKAQDYLYATEWMAGDKLKFSYQGNIGNEDKFICRLVRGGNPRLAFVEAIAAEPEPEVKFDYEDYTFTLLAGGSEGSKDGKGAAAQFKWPHGLAVDPAGNVFVGDRGNYLIRKITSDGTVTTLAGSPGKYGRVDGIGEAARFWYPMGTALDASGNIYVADSSGQAIRKVTPAGAVSTLAGTPETAERKLGFGEVHYLHHPTGVAVDKNGNVFVGDSNNFVIRKIAPDGTLTTVAGLPGTAGTTDGDAKSARFVFPGGVALDAKGNLYVTDKMSIRKIDTSGVVSTLAGSSDDIGTTDGTGSAARFSNPNAIASDSAGNVYVADNGNKNVRKITPDGVVKTLRDVGNAAAFGSPSGIAVDDKGQVYVADQDGFRVIVGKPAK
jgi:sugar lactone lactonase YvrE